MSSMALHASYSNPLRVNVSPPYCDVHGAPLYPRPFRRVPHGALPCPSCTSRSGRRTHSIRVTPRTHWPVLLDAGERAERRENRLPGGDGVSTATHLTVSLVSFTSQSLSPRACERGGAFRRTLDVGELSQRVARSSSSERVDRVDSQCTATRTATV